MSPSASTSRRLWDSRLAAACGFFGRPTAGALGATAALSRLVQFDGRQFRDAWGLAYSQLAGTMQAHVEGSVALPLQVAVAARAAVNSIELVEQELSGPHDILEGPFGYFTLFEESGDLDTLLPELGRRWRVTELSHKPFPTGRAAHGTLDALLTLQQRHAFALEDVREVRAYVPPLIHRLVARPIETVMTRSYARLCLQYLVPTLLRHGTIDTASFGNERLADQEILEAGACVQVIIDDNDDPNAMRPQRIEVSLHSGVSHEARIEHTLGSPQRPLDRQSVLGEVSPLLEGRRLSDAPGGSTRPMFGELGGCRANRGSDGSRVEAALVRFLTAAHVHSLARNVLGLVRAQIRAGFCDVFSQTRPAQRDS